MSSPDELAPKGSIPRYYANWIAPRGNLYDMALDFGFTREPDAPPDIEWLAEVVLSWEEVATLHEMLTRHLAAYQEGAGEIRRWGDSPPDIDPSTNGNPEPTE